jgi:hypothetical protein
MRLLFKHFLKFMNEQMPAMNSISESEDDLEGLSNPYATYERLVAEQTVYIGEMTQLVRRTIMELQSQDRLPSAPMSNSDRNSLVTSLIQALDRGLCFDDDQAKELWILDGAKRIYESSHST